MFKYVIAATALALVAVAPASAATITTLYSTGVDNAGVATTGNGADLHWSLAGGTAYTGAANNVYPISPWVNESATSRWITPTNNAADGNPTTSFIYSTTFSLTGFQVATASFTGKFAADDQVTSILLNGTAIGAIGGGYTSFTSFSSTGGSFVAGLNTLTFVTLNSGSGPSGLNVELSGNASVVPEPAIWGLMVTGFGMVGFAARRRTRAVAA